MDLQSKKREFLRGLRNLNFENLFDINDEGADSVLFETAQRIENGTILITVEMRDNICNIVHYHIAKLNNVNRKEQVMDLLNELNTKQTVTKYFLDGNSIIAQIPYFTNNFDGQELVDLTLLGFDLIKRDAYNKLMRIIWS